jgi:hypothetical protein
MPESRVLSKQHIILIIIILAIIFLFINSRIEKKENKEKKENFDTCVHEMYIPNCNMLNDEETCSNTKGCVYKNGCYYDWMKLQ